MRMQQAEVLLRSQAEAALRLAVSQAAAAAASSSQEGAAGANHVQRALQGHGGHNAANLLAQNLMGSPTAAADLSEALRFQEQRLEQALRLHGDPRALGFTLNNSP